MKNYFIDKINFRLLICLAGLLVQTGCFSSISKDQLSTGDSQTGLIVSKSSEDENQKIDVVTLEISQSVSIYSLFKEDGVYSNVSASWTLNGDIGDLLILSAGKGAQFTATKSGSGSVIVVSGDTRLVVPIVVADNASPVAVADEYFVEANTSGNTFNIIANDTDADGDELSILTINYSGSATITDLGTGSIQVDASGFYGKEILTYEISDGKGDPVTGTVTLKFVSKYSWLGYTDSNFSSASNWCGTIVDGECQKDLAAPDSTKVAVLSDVCTNCNVNLTSNIDVKGIRLSSNYAGSFSQETYIMLLGTSGWVQYNGSFVGGDKAFESAGDILVSGGTFTATSSNTRLTSYDTELKVQTPANFIHNFGTFQIYSYSNVGCVTHYFDINTDTNLELNNLYVRFIDDACNGYGNGVYRKLGTGDVSILGNMTVDAGKFESGTLNLKGNAIFTCIGGDVCSRGGSGVLKFNGGKNQTYDIASGGSVPAIYVDNPGFSVEPTVSTLSGYGSNITVASGSFVGLPGNFSMSSDNFRPSIVHSGGSIDLTSTNIILSGSSDTGVCNNSFATISSTSALTVNGFHVNLVDTGCNGYTNLGVNIHSAGLNVLQDLRVEAGVLNGGQISVQGKVRFDCTAVNDCAQGGNSKILVNGSVLQNFTVASGAKLPINEFIIDKPGGTLRMAGNVNFRGTGSGNDLIFRQGSFDLYGFNLAGVDGYEQGASVGITKSTGTFKYAYCISPSCTPSD